jgi:phenylpyruvate tautomerase PptA (4-oxalocrotonate tautomerase family)
MPFYEVDHSCTLTEGQKDELAEALTTIHSTKFMTPKLFVNVAFKPMTTDFYVAGKRKAPNMISAHVRTGGGRDKSQWDELCDEVLEAWESIVGKLPKVKVYPTHGTSDTVVDNNCRE